MITYTYWLLATLILLSHIPQQESKNIIMQNPNGAYPAEDRPRLREILQLWKLEILYDRLVGNTFNYIYIYIIMMRYIHFYN